MKIVITGSLGNISKTLAQELIKNGHSVTVISSTPEKPKSIEELGATAAIGSLADADFLTKTLTGTDALYCMTPFDFKERNQDTYFQNIGNSYLTAIKKTGINKVVFLSGWTAGVVKTHSADPILDQLTDIAVAELRPGAFYTNFYNYIGMIKESGASHGWIITSIFLCWIFTAFL